MWLQDLNAKDGSSAGLLPTQVQQVPMEIVPDTTPPFIVFHVNGKNITTATGATAMITTLTAGSSYVTGVATAYDAVTSNPSVLKNITSKLKIKASSHGVQRTPERSFVCEPSKTER